MRFLTLFLALALCAPLGAPLDAASFLYPISAPFRIYTDSQGKPLSGGFVYFGVANQNPETTPVQVFWDAAGTIPALQPIRTISGYFSRNGTPANVFVSGDISTTVRDAGGALLFTSPTSTDLQFAQAVLNTSNSAVGIGIADIGGFYTTKNVEAALQQAAGPGFVSLQSLTAAVVQTLLPTGAILDYTGSGASGQAPAGFVFGSGQTIGSAASGATSSGHQRANADTQALYTLLWNTYANAQLPIQDSTGTPTTRGVSASADFTANKRLPTPDYRGRVRAALDNLGGNTASRLTAALNFDGTVMGNSGGSQSHTMTVAEMASHNHTATDSGHTHAITDPGHVHAMAPIPDVSQKITVNAPSGSASSYNASVATATPNVVSNVTGITINSGTANITVGSSGSGNAHSIVQPTTVCTVLIKL